uniref:R3H domain-containing protein n=1 Tax=Parascaris univalens TaxID=6257 RepID=A0A915BDU2_PARUN
MSLDEPIEASSTVAQSNGTTQKLLSARQNKLAKLGKQDGVDEEEMERYDESLNEDSGEQNGQSDMASHTKIIDVTNRTTDVLMPPSENLQRVLPPSSLYAGVSKPKLLVRSHALCGDDDTRLAVRYSSAPRLSATRSNASSLSVESNYEMYTDSTGIDLQAFIASTLHKNAKDRQMLLQLERNMCMLVNDPSRHSQKFPVMSSYNRMLVHRVAAFFGLDHNVDQSGTAVVVNKTAQTRIPDVEFSSLIRSDIFTDEPRRYLRRDAQSFEEGRQCFGANPLIGRRAHSFEVGECAIPNSQRLAAAYQLPITAQLHMNVFPQQDSTSTDASSTHLLESPGSCYSYGEMPYMGVYSQSDGAASYGAHPTAHMYPWSSSSESYTSYSSSVDLPPHVVSPAVHSPNRRPPLLAKCGSVEAGVGMYKNSNAHMGFIEQRPSPGRRVSAERRRTSEGVPVREPSIPEHVTVSNPLDDDNDGVVPSAQPTVYYAITSAEQYQPAPYVVGAVPRQPYAAMPPYVQCLPANIPNACQIQGVAQQMESLCIGESGEVIPSQVYAYSLPQAPQPAIPPQQMAPSAHIGAYYTNQCYFFPVLPQGYVVPGTASPSLYRMGSVAMGARPAFECSPAPEGTYVEADPGTNGQQFSSAAEQF